MKTSSSQRNVVKTTSLQVWSRLTSDYFHHKLRIEERKDREHIYTLLRKMGLQCEDFRVIKNVTELTKKGFSKVVSELGYPYWLSATPKVGVNDIDRLSKLRLNSVKEGWEFVQSLTRVQDYKLIAMQYADDPVFKGSALVSKRLNGIVDFVRGDRHVQLIEGLTLSDPMLFGKDGIVRYSLLTKRDYQKELFSYICKYPGHFEFQYGDINGKKGISFFDYNDEPAYEDIDDLHQGLIRHYDLDSSKNNGGVIRGLPASPGKVYGNCRVVLSSKSKVANSIGEKEVLVTDATSPSMIFLMSKASAIVTDLGGVTSHAAIVCREMKIPCIVGTKDATRKLKNGMFVLVDAFEGKVVVKEK